jgi:Ulp1 family protease
LGEQVSVQETEETVAKRTEPLPPLLLPHHTTEHNPETVQFLTEMWGLEGQFMDIEGVQFGHPELVRLLHYRGADAFINDNIVDCTCNMLNEKEGDFWVMPSHLYGKYMMKDPLDRWVGRSIKKWAKKWEKGHVPHYIMLPFAVDLHYRVVVWDTHRDKVIYLDPLHPTPSSADDSWVQFSVEICSKIRTSWSTHHLPPPEYGFNIPPFPRQVDGVSCGLYVILYMLMFANNWVAVTFPPEGTNLMRVILARLIMQKKLPIGQLKRFFSAMDNTTEDDY